MKNVFFICILLFVSMCSLYCQNRIISGRVINDQLEYMPFVSISIEQNIKVCKTDLEGFFQIEVPMSINKISFNSVGLETTTIQLVDDCNVIEIVMMLSGTYDFITLKKADRLRKKTFKKLQKLHKLAFERGLFRTDKACYIQEFIPLAHSMIKQKN
jgi:hypothetical protein